MENDIEDLHFSGSIRKHDGSYTAEICLVAKTEPGPSSSHHEPRTDAERDCQPAHRTHRKNRRSESIDVAEWPERQGVERCSGRLEYEVLAEKGR